MITVRHGLMPEGNRMESSKLPAYVEADGLLLFAAFRVMRMIAYRLFF